MGAKSAILGSRAYCSSQWKSVYSDPVAWNFRVCECVLRKNKAGRRDQISRQGCAIFAFQIGRTQVFIWEMIYWAKVGVNDLGH